MGGHSGELSWQKLPIAPMTITLRKCIRYTSCDLPGKCNLFFFSKIWSVSKVVRTNTFFVSVGLLEYLSMYSCACAWYLIKETRDLTC